MLEEVTPKFIPRLLQSEGAVLLAAGDYDAAVEKMAKALELARCTFPNDLDSSLATYHHSYGRALLASCRSMKTARPTARGLKQLEDDARAARESLERSRVVCERWLGEVCGEERKECLELLAKVCADVGKALVMQGKGEEAVEEYNKMLKIGKEIYMSDSKELAETYFTIASELAIVDGKESEALDFLIESIRVLRNCLMNAARDRKENTLEEAKELSANNCELITPNKPDISELNELKRSMLNFWKKVNFLHTL